MTAAERERMARSPLEPLSVADGRVVGVDGLPVRLRGVNIGGWLNLEHFLTGYPGTESGLRRAMTRIGPRAELFFARLRHYWFADEDAAFIASHGLNAVRLPLNYRLLESDQRPRVYDAVGFEVLDDAVDRCRRHGLYVILDLHAVQGWQNGDWHSDNASRHALFWRHKDFQDRFVELWRAIASRYAGDTTFAAFDLINEPLSNAPFGRLEPDEAYEPDWNAVNKLYRRTVETIREVDSDRILILEGDNYATRFAGLDAPFDDRLIYSSHEYIPPATDPIAAYPATIGGRRWDRASVVRQFEAGEGRRFCAAHDVDQLVGEFGVSVGDGSDPEAKARVLADQIEAFEASGSHWTFWSYKGVGPMTWVHPTPTSPYLQAIAPVLAAKAALGVDFGWLAGFPPGVQGPIDALTDALVAVAPRSDRTTTARYMGQAAIAGYAAEHLQRIFVDCLTGLDDAAMEEAMQSFALSGCVIRAEVSAVIRGAGTSTHRTARGVR